MTSNKRQRVESKSSTDKDIVCIGDDLGSSQYLDIFIICNDGNVKASKFILHNHSQLLAGIINSGVSNFPSKYGVTSVQEWVNVTHNRFSDMKISDVDEFLSVCDEYESPDLLKQTIYKDFSKYITTTSILVKLTYRPYELMTFKIILAKLRSVNDPEVFKKISNEFLFTLFKHREFGDFIRYNL